MLTLTPEAVHLLNTTKEWKNLHLCQNLCCRNIY